MSNFERGPKEKKDPIAVRQELEYGKFSMPDEEKKRKVKEAIAEGRDPEEALREHEERLAQANARLRENDKEEAISGLEREMNKQFGDKKKESE